MTKKKKVETFKTNYEAYQSTQEGVSSCVRKKNVSKAYNVMMPSHFVIILCIVIYLKELQFLFLIYDVNIRGGSRIL